jgi:hypothetical protein
MAVVITVGGSNSSHLVGQFHYLQISLAPLLPTPIYIRSILLLISINFHQHTNTTATKSGGVDIATTKPATNKKKIGLKNMNLTVRRSQR